MSNLPVVYTAIDEAINLWLAARAANSQRTAQAYRDTMQQFRAALAQAGADLLSDPALVARIAETFAASSTTGKPVAPATFNLRLTILSSFYLYCHKKAALDGRIVINPIQAIDRRKRQPYARALPLDSKAVKKALKAIDRATLQGKRDYALLTVLLATGRRLSEVTAMTRGDLTIADRVFCTFPNCKGGKVMHDKLTPVQSQALVEWLHAYYGKDLGNLPADAPIWVSLSHRNYGKPMGIQTVGDVCEKYLGTSKVHALRHTFAVSMEEAGASVADIKERLGHSSLSETSIYLERLHSAENRYGDSLDDLFGIGD